jgi:hypothetical protein
VVTAAAVGLTEDPELAWRVFHTAAGGEAGRNLAGWRAAAMAR